MCRKLWPKTTVSRDFLNYPLAEFSRSNYFEKSWSDPSAALGVVEEALYLGFPDVNSPIINFCARCHIFWKRLRKPTGAWRSCWGTTEAITMVHYFLAALWWLKWDSPFAKTLQTLSTLAFSWQATVIFKTGTFAQSCSLIFSLGLYVLYWYCHFGNSICSVTLYHLPPLSFFLCSSSFCPPLINFSSSPSFPPSSPTQADHRQGNIQPFFFGCVKT